MTTHTSTGPTSSAHNHHHHHDHSAPEGYAAAMHSRDHHGLGNANAAHFDNHVAGPGSMQGIFAELYTAIEGELKSRTEWFGLKTPLRSGGSGDPVRLFDYACGGGHGTKTLLPYIDEAIGMDVSGKSVEAYNIWAKDNGLEDAMRGVQANLMLDSASDNITSDPTLFNFDLIIIVMALHHVADAALLFKQLVPRLKAATGHLVVIDWDSDGRALQLPKFDHGAQEVVEKTTDHHHRMGFSKQQMGQFYEEAGCEGVVFERVEKETGIGDLFISKGVRRAN